jgi:hypothetical protein
MSTLIGNQNTDYSTKTDRYISEQWGIEPMINRNFLPANAISIKLKNTGPVDLSNYIKLIERKQTTAGTPIIALKRESSSVIASPAPQGVHPEEIATSKVLSNSLIEFWKKEPKFGLGLRRFALKTEEVLSFVSIIPIVGGTLKGAMGVVQSIAALVAGIFASVPAIFNVGKSRPIFFEALKHAKHGLVNIITGIFEAIPGVGVAKFVRKCIIQRRLISSGAQVTGQEHKMFSYKNID